MMRDPSSEKPIVKMVDDQQMVGSDHDSVDTAATCRSEYFDGGSQIVENDFGGDNYVPGGFKKSRLSLEARRQIELKNQSTVNALNHFILLAGNIYKGTKLSKHDETRLRDAAREAGVSVNVVDVLIEQTADQNAIVNYCMTSDDVFAQKMKQDPQLSRILLKDDENNPEKGNGLNVSNSVWRILMHKIIKQFLKEQNMQLTDIIENSSHTRRLYEETLSFGPRQNRFDTARLPRDYSEERKHVFITEAEAKQARMEASEAMVKSQQFRNPYVYDLVNGTSVQSQQKFPRLIAQNAFDVLDSRDDDLSMVPCATERNSSLVQHVEPILYPTDDLDVVSCTIKETNMRSKEIFSGHSDSRDDGLYETERNPSFVPRVQIDTTEPYDLDIQDDLDLIPCPPEPDVSCVRADFFSGTNDNSSKTLLKTSIEQKPSPSQREIDRENSDKKLRQSPDTPKRGVLQSTTRNNISETNTASAVKRRIAMYENGSIISPQPQTKNGKLKQGEFPIGNILQARALFENIEQPSQNTIEQSTPPRPLGKVDQRSFHSGNVLQARAMFENKEQQPQNAIELSASPRSNRKFDQDSFPGGNVLQARSMFENKEQQPQNATELFTSPRPIGKFDQKSFPGGNVLQARAMFENKEQQTQVVGEINRKRTNKNIQDVLATWTQKEQENPRMSVQKDSNNQVDGKSSTNIKKENASKEYAREVEDRSVIMEEGIDVERYEKLRQRHRHREPVMGDETSFDMGRIDLDAEEEVKVGIQKVQVDEMQGSEFHSKHRSVRKRNKVKLHDADSIDVNDGDGSDENSDSENALQSRFPLDKNLESKSMNASEKMNQKPFPTELYDTNDSCADNHDSGIILEKKHSLLDKKPVLFTDYDSEDADPVEMYNGNEGSDFNSDSENVPPDTLFVLKQNHELHSTTGPEKKVQESDPIAHFESKHRRLDPYPSHAGVSNGLYGKDDGKPQQWSSESEMRQKVTDAQTGSKSPSLRRFSEHDRTIFNQSVVMENINQIVVTENESNFNQILVMEEEIDGSLAYVRSTSDDSSRIRIPPSEQQSEEFSSEHKNATALRNEQAQCQQHTEKKYGEVSTLMIPVYTHDLPVSPNENAWTEFESNNSFLDNVDKKLQHQDISYRSDRVEGKHQGYVARKMTGSTETRSNCQREERVGNDAWANFESEKTFHEQPQESSMSHGRLDNAQSIHNRKYDIAPPDRVQSVEVFNDQPQNDSGGRTISRATKQRRTEDTSSSLRAGGKSDRVQKVLALPSISKTSKENCQSPNDTNFGPFNFAQFPDLSTHEKSSDASSAETTTKDLGGNKFRFNNEDNLYLTHHTEERAVIDHKLFVEGVDVEFDTSATFHDEKKLESRSNRLEPNTNLHQGKQSNVDPKDFFASFLPRDTSSIFVETLSDEQNLLHQQVRIPNNNALSSEKVHQMSPECFHREETHYERKNQRDDSWEFFTSNFQSKSQRDASVANVPSKNGDLKPIYGNDEDNQQLESSFNCGPTDISFAHHPSDLEKKTPLHIKERRMLKDNRFPQDIPLSGSSTLCSDKKQRRGCLQPDAAGNSSRSSSTFEVHDGCSDESIDKIMPSIPRTHGSTRQISEGRLYSKTDSFDESSPATNAIELNATTSLNKVTDPIMNSIPSRNESAVRESEQRKLISNQPDRSSESAARDEFKTTSPLSERENSSKLGRKDYCITLSDSNSILEHNQGIRDFLEQRGDMPEEGAGERMQLSERIHADKNLQNRDAISEERNHLEALSEFLTAYRHDENQKVSAPKQSRVDPRQERNDRTELQDHTEVRNSANRISRRDGANEDWSDMVPARSNVTAVDFDDNALTNYSETLNPVNKGDNEPMESHEVTWPTDDGSYNARASTGSNASAKLRTYQSTIQEEDDHSQELMPRSIHHRKSFNSINDDITKDKYSERTRDSTEYLVQQQKERLHRQDQLYSGPVVRVLDRPLLDLDDDECFEEIEVERQDSYDRGPRDPEPRTAYASDPQSFEMDSKPDPLPDPSPKEKRRLSPKGSRRLSYVTPGSNNTAEAPEGATEEELKLLNHFIEVASGNFGGNTLSADSEARVRSAALKVGLTSKFVDQLLSQTTKQKEDSNPRLSFIPSEQPPPSHGLEQKPHNYQESQYNHNDYNTHQNNASNYVVNDYGENGTSDGIDYYSRKTAESRRRHERPTDDCNVWDNLGKTFGLLANMTARACGVEYHNRNNRTTRDDASSIVSALSWEDDTTGVRKRRSERPRESIDTAEYFAPMSYPVDQRQEGRAHRVTFASDTEQEAKGQETNTTQNEPSTPPRPKITQLV